MSESLSFDNLKTQWRKQEAIEKNTIKYDPNALQGLIKSRMIKQNKKIMGYFWMTLAMHIAVYAALSHLAIKYGMNDPLILAISLFGILITVPFTWVLIKKFKEMASNRPINNQPESLKSFIQRKKLFLSDFFHFKSIYEWFLIPIQTAVGVFISFYLWVPGGITLYPEVAFACYMLTLLSCIFAVKTENTNYFTKPIQELKQLLMEFQE